MRAFVPCSMSQNKIRSNRANQELLKKGLSLYSGARVEKSPQSRDVMKRKEGQDEKANIGKNGKCGKLGTFFEFVEKKIMLRSDGRISSVKV